mgnify:CR=1 FL=1
MNTTLKGKRNTPQATEFQLQIFHCSRNTNAKECYNTTYIDTLNKFIVISYYYPERYIDVNDYENPIKEYWYNEMVAMDTSTYG